MNRTILLLATLPVVLSQTIKAQSARDYFNELYQAGGLDRVADEYVCFDDSPDLQNFFIYGESEVLKQYLIENGQFAKMPKQQQEQLNKGFLIVRGYSKGVPVGDESFYIKDGSSWVTDPGTAGASKVPMRVRLTIAPATLRYKRAVELLNPDLTYKSEVARFGRCEAIPTGVQQKGNP